MNTYLNRAAHRTVATACSLSLLLIACEPKPVTSTNIVPDEGATPPTASANTANFRPQQSSVFPTGPVIPLAPRPRRPVSADESDFEEFSIVLFDTNSPTLSSQAYANIRQQADWLTMHPNITVTVEGSADERGTSRRNQELGRQRAENVKNALIGLGILPSRIHTRNRGATTDGREDYLQANRRAKTEID